MQKAEPPSRVLGARYQGAASRAERAAALPLDEVAAEVTLTDVDVFAGGEDAGARTARVVLRFDGAPVFRRGELVAVAGKPRRMFLELERVRVERAVPAPRSVFAGGLIRFHAETWQAAGASGWRLVFELRADARYRLFSLSDPHRLVIDLERPVGSDVVRRSRAPLVLLDPGHGGDDRGAVGPFGQTEDALTLDIARRTRARLARLAPGVRVRMTRDSDVLLSLEERAAMANALGASLFVSIHLNASSQPIERGGVATFVLDVNNDRNVLRLAARENGTRTRSVSELQYLVGSLVRAEQARESRRAARLVQQGMLREGRRFMPRLNDRGVRSAMFHVLVGAQMPALLLEASFLTQPEEARLLAQPSYRQALAEGIARGALKYLRARPSDG